MTEEKKQTISEGLILAGIPIIAYFYAFIYELGYSSYHKLPVELITINLTSFFTFLVSVSVFLLFFLSLYNIWITITANSEMSAFTKLLIVRITFVVVFSFFAIIFWGTEPAFWISWFLSMLFFTFLEFIYPIIFFKKEKSYKDKLIAAEIRDREIKSGFDVMADSIGRRNYFAIYLLVLGLLFTFGFGSFKARTRISYLTIPTNVQAEEYVVLRIYGDNIVCKKYSNKFRVLSNEIKILNIKDCQNLLMIPKTFIPFIVEK